MASRYEPDAVKAKYLSERDNRLVPGRADIRDLASDPDFARDRADPFTPYDRRALSGRRPLDLGTFSLESLGGDSGQLLIGAWQLAANSS
jgi:hypothetical protein